MKNILCVLLVILVCFSVLPVKAQNPADSIYNIQDSILIPTQSGIPVCAIIVRKKTNTKPLPVVLFYTTYYQGPGDSFFGKRSADRDYVGVVAYARGIRTGIENYQPYEHEATDIYDIIDWISKQSWCDGRVGMYGGSYTGYAQWAAAKKLHPALKTIVPQVAVMPGFDFPMENNVPITNILSWPNDNVYKYKPLPRDLPFIYFDNGYAFKRLDSIAGQPNPLFQKWLTHPAYDVYWQSMIPTPDEFSKIDIPVLSTTGYYDGCEISALQYFRLHHKYNKKARHYLVTGPYDHWGGQRKASPELMGYAIDSVARQNMMELAYQWMDYILKKGPKPEILKDKVNFEVMGANKWRHVSSPDKMSNDTLTLYLSAATSGTSYALQSKRPPVRQYLSQTVDFKDREAQNSYYTPSIVFESLDTGNGLVFMTPPFEKDFAVSGSFYGSLMTTINKKDMDISLALYELMPDGKYFFLTRYIGRASYARDNTRRQLLTPGKKERVSFNNTRLVSRRITKGSRLVVLLNINKHPFEIINYGSGKEVKDETIDDAGVPLLIKWHNDSFIKIPVWR